MIVKEIINLTEYKVVLRAGSSLVEFEPSGTVARIEERGERVQEMGFWSGGEELYAPVFRLDRHPLTVSGIPIELKEMVYIVSRGVLAATRYRGDVIAPDTREAGTREGGVLAVSGFLR